MKYVQCCVCLAVCIFFQTLVYAQQPAGPTESAPAGASNSPMGPAAPSGPPILLKPSGAAPGPMPEGRGGPGPLYFASGVVSPDGKMMYVAFDRYLMCYVLPSLKLARKIDLGLPAVPMSPSVSVSPDGKWIYVIQNGTIFQIEKETFKIKTSEKIRP